MVRFFYIAIAAGKRSYVERALDVIEEWNGKTRPLGIQIGALLRFTNSNARPHCMACKLAKKRGLPVFIDNGAFTYLKSLDSKVNPWDVDRWLWDYKLFIEKFQDTIDYFALPDIPVHGRRFVPPPERVERVKLSARLHRRFLDMIPRKAWPKAVPVIQGYTLVEYEDSYWSLARNGVLNVTAYMESEDYHGIVAVGSVCVRKPSSKGKTGLLADGEAAGTLDPFIQEILEYGEIPAGGFHFFGLHREAVSKYGRHERFHASDTGAHGLNFRLKWKTFLKCKRQDEECYARSIQHQLQVTLKPIMKTALARWLRLNRES